jgi:anti-anti-sigma regulatory factor
MSTLKIQSKPDVVGTVRLEVAGRMNANSLGDLRRTMERIRRKRSRVSLDLSEITLLDRASIQFLAEQCSADVELINCPPYLEAWLKKA